MAATTHCGLLVLLSVRSLAVQVPQNAHPSPSSHLINALREQKRLSQSGTLQRDWEVCSAELADPSS